MTRQAYVLDEHRLVVFWARKAGCTSIVDSVMFDILGQDPDQFRAGARRKRSWLNQNGYRLDHRAAARVIKTRGYRSIAMVREPYDRLISVFLNTFVRHEGRPVRRFADLPWFSQDFCRQIADQAPWRQDFKYQGLSFHDFVTAVCDRIERRQTFAFHDRYVIARTRGCRIALRPPRPPEPWLNPHWNTQIPFSYLRQAFTYDELFTIDRSGAFFEKLSDMTGCAIMDKRSNRSNYAQPDQARDLPSLVKVNPLDYADNPAAMNKALFWSDALKHRVERAFAPDYLYIRNHASN